MLVRRAYTTLSTPELRADHDARLGLVSTHTTAHLHAPAASQCTASQCTAFPQRCALVRGMHAAPAAPLPEPVGCAAAPAAAATLSQHACKDRDDHSCIVLPHPELLTLPAHGVRAGGRWFAALPTRASPRPAQGATASCQFPSLLAPPPPRVSKDLYCASVPSICPFPHVHAPGHGPSARPPVRAVRAMAEGGGSWWVSVGRGRDEGGVQPPAGKGTEMVTVSLRERG